jgi:hypothetical protein
VSGFVFGAPVAIEAIDIKIAPLKTNWGVRKASPARRQNEIIRTSSAPTTFIVDRGAHHHGVHSWGHASIEALERAA